MRFLPGLFCALLLAATLLLTLPACQQQASRPPAPMEAFAGQYRIYVQLPSVPLKTGRTTYTLVAEEIQTKQPVDSDSLTAKVTMTMPDHAMEAPTSVKKLPEPGRYELATEFTMAGEWVLEVKPTPAAEPVSLTLPVEADE